MPWIQTEEGGLVWEPDNTGIPASLASTAAPTPYTSSASTPASTNNMIVGGNGNQDDTFSVKGPKVLTEMPEFGMPAVAGPESDEFTSYNLFGSASGPAGIFDKPKVDPNAVSSVSSGAGSPNMSGMETNAQFMGSVYENMARSNPQVLYQAWAKVYNSPFSFEQFQENLNSGGIDIASYGDNPQIAAEFAAILNQSTDDVLSYFGPTGDGSPEGQIIKKGVNNYNSLTDEQKVIFDKAINDGQTGNYLSNTARYDLNRAGLLQGDGVQDSSGVNIFGINDSQVSTAFNPAEQGQAQEYLFEINKYMMGLRGSVPPLPTNLARSYQDANGILQYTPEYQELVDTYQSALASEEGRQLQEQSFQNELEIQREQLDAQADRLAEEIQANLEVAGMSAESANYASYVEAYKSDNTYKLERYLQARRDSQAGLEREQQLQLARITQRTEQEIANMYSQAQVAVAERNGISAREVADIQAGVAAAGVAGDIEIASIQQQMQQEIARLTGLDERYIADQQAEVAKAVALADRETQAQIALEDRTTNIQIAQSTNSTEEAIAKINADAQIAIAENNRISQETVALANSANVVAAAEATGLSQEAVARIQGEWNKQVSDATGLSQQQVAQIQAASQENTASIQASAQRVVGEAQAQAQIQSAQQAAQAQTGVAQLGAAEQRFATTTEASTQRNIAQLQADTQTQIAQIQADTTRDQAQKDVEIANVQRQAQEAIARIQQEGQLAVAQQQTNPFGLSPAQYMQMQTQQTAPSPAETLTTQQYIYLQESLARGGLTPAQQIQLYEAQQQAQGASQRAGLSPEQFIGLQESVARGGLTADQRLAEQQQGQQVQALTSLLSLLSNPSALGSLSALSTGQTPFGTTIPSAAALQGRSNEFLNFLQGAFGALGVTPSALVNLVQGVTPAGISNPFGALTGQVA